MADPRDEACARCGEIHTRCTAHSKRQKRADPQARDHPCGAWPINGGTVCPKHGGATGVVRAAAKRRLQADAAARAAVTYGLPVDIDPAVALLDEVHRTAGHVAWLSVVVADLERGQLRQYSREKGGLLFERPSVWVELYQSERRHLAAVCKAALDAGVAERQVRLVERQGELIGQLLTAAIEAAGLSPEQKERAYDGARRQLALVGSTVAT